MYEFEKFVETKDHIKTFRKEATSFLNEQESAFLATLSDEEVGELLEFSWNPADWARAGMRGVGQLGRGIANIPSHIQAGYHGIDTGATGGVNTQAFKNQLASKQYGVDPNQYNTGKKGAFDQAAFDKGVQDAQVSKMTPDQQRQHYQTQTAGVQDQIGVQKAKNDLQAAQQGAQPKPAKTPSVNAKTIMAGLGKIKGMTPAMAKQIATVLGGMGIK